MKWRREVDTDGAKALACAIVNQALLDYKFEVSVLRRNKFLSYRAKEAVANIRELRRFFRSEWYAALCDVPGEDVIREMEKGLRMKF